MNQENMLAPRDLHTARYYWEDLEPGFSFETASRTVTEADVVSFAALSADYNRVHVDAEYAASTPWGARIAHGMLVASIVSGLNTRTVVNQLLEPSLIGMLETRIRFPKPTLIGDTIKARIEISDRRETSNPARGIVDFRRVAVNQRGETVCECDVRMMVLRRAQNDS
ncbi:MULTISPECIES: MaoC/PaaZ C-terminal domain-containing protein [Caballeronia]|jgi:acyl dehydratase|uniref:Acyl dehydratase n=1 Tax=Caballeronia zhejiangensis TaxID=871203 RepID=A0A656QG70_9BURK|nr:MULTISPECIES: MaoC/PaaZ C-terminal domain-containing protein [Caballeronia]EKS69496.1 acyl dehydratase [Burkholderia sp. SJ98]KDR29634.1 acyl dehydratase [Caballeronia zhejiangensis]MCG7401667.1 MaoC family dehydratase N-terminal domain-containing protein [Caballeronia zhejiangensis]MCI1045237.1 MaoC family dehydratase N-terminal domain-containing protein [Caballeronia zhejiangensis]MDR5767086.1 MaoC/PaaZ C-terminal domain-containing protein [Caballeronia sp. LZ028]